MKLEEFKQVLIKDQTEGYEVGGFLRDFYHNKFHNCDNISYDIDYVVCGYDIKSFEKSFPDAFKIGTEANIIENGVEKTERTPVYLLTINNIKCEVALARNEQKVSDGYAGFAFTYGKEITIEDDLARRDFTINAIARNLVTGEVVDPFGGIQDVQNKLIRGIYIKDKTRTIHSDFLFDEINKEFLIQKNGETFVSKLPQDPVRALRAARLAAKLNYSIEKTTSESLKHLKNEIKITHPNRIYGETKKALVSANPELFFQHLSDISLLEDVFPELNDLKGLTQSSEFHPEGDAFVHTLQVVSAASVLTKILLPGDEESLEKNTLSALLHDVGKKTAQFYDAEKDVFHYWEHENLGINLAKNVIERFQLKKMENHLLTSVSQHMYLHNNLNKVKLNKVLFHLVGGYKRLSLSEKTTTAILESVVLPSELKNHTTPGSLNELIKQKEMNWKKNKRDFTTSLRFKEELLSKQISFKDFSKQTDQKRFLNEKSLNPSSLRKWCVISKEKGIVNFMDALNYFIVCASDTLGRLENTDNKEAIFTEAALLIKGNKHFSKTAKELKINEWKTKFNLTENYTSKFSSLLSNILLCEELIEIHQNTTVNFEPKDWEESDKKPDELALIKDEELHKIVKKTYQANKTK